jgi:Tol biopolymer transport system component
VGPAGEQADGRSDRPALSADGRYVAFSSSATNLVASDNNSTGDVFVRDRETGTTERVSIAYNGLETDLPSGSPTLSAGGRWVAFDSTATNLVPGDTNGTGDVFVRDRQTGATRRVSVGPGGIEGNGDLGGRGAISATGRFVAFFSEATNLVPGDTNGTFDVFVHDTATGMTRRASVGHGGAQADGFSGSPALSGSGRFVVFDSDATNLVPGDNNGSVDVFVHDLELGKTTGVSVGPGIVDGDDQSRDAAISADGRFVAFGSPATNFVQGDTNGAFDVFVRDFLP